MQPKSIILFFYGYILFFRRHIFIPCHRVIASNGLGGYNGGLAIKRFLLECEGVDLSQFKNKLGD